MPQVQLVLLPKDLTADHVHNRAVAVFDVLRATTSITAALAAGVKEVRIFAEIPSATDAARDYAGEKILCGESKCLPPPGFDLGNSPGAFNSKHRDRVAFLATTNGTRAIIAARGAAELFTAALVNASAVARRLIQSGRDVTLLCAGSGGQVSMEDVLGAGAVISALNEFDISGDATRIAARLFHQNRNNLRELLRQSQGGQNIIAAGLTDDIDFCAKLDSFTVVGQVHDSPLRVTR